MFATDGRIPAFDFVVLADDKGFFPSYALTPVVRKETLDKNPKLAELLNGLSAKLDDATMAKLNATVDVEKKTIEDVSADIPEVARADLSVGGAATNAIAFIHGLTFEDLPAEVVAQAKRCLLDLIGVAASGRQTALSRIVHGFAVSQMGAATGGARLMFDGRRASVTGAAYAGASTINSFDAHDGHRLTKGHAGVAVLPALLAFAEQNADRWARIRHLPGARIRDRDPRRHRAARDRARLPHLGRLECARLARRSARACSGLIRRRRAMRWVSPNITGRAAR